MTRPPVSEQDERNDLGRASAAQTSRSGSVQGSAEDTAFRQRFWALGMERPDLFRDLIAEFLERLSDKTESR